MLEFDKKYFSKFNLVAGVDEAGRGPLAGPVVASAVIYDKNTYIEGVDDSKKISSKLKSIKSEKISETQNSDEKISEDGNSETDAAENADRNNKNAENKKDKESKNE